MKRRLIQAVVVSVVAALGGVAVALWHKPDQIVPIVLAATAVGFIFGL